MENNLNLDILQNYGGFQANSLTNLIQSNSDIDDENLSKTSSYYSPEDYITHMHDLSHCFNIISLNVQSLSAKYDKLCTFLELLSDGNAEPSAFCLQESWMSSDIDLSSFQLQNYHCISQAKSVSLHSGLVTYLHKRYGYNLLDLSDPSDVWEFQAIDIPATPHNKHVILINVYKPSKDNSNNNIETFISELSSLLQKISRSKANILITGDFNINLLDINHRRVFGDFLNLMSTNGFCPEIKLPTRFTDNSCTLIDNICYKNSVNSLCASSGILLTDISDHLPCFVSVNISVKTNYNTTSTYVQKTWKPKLIQKLYDQIELMDIYKYLNKDPSTDPNINYKIFETHISSAINNVMPNKKLNIININIRKQNG